MLFSKLIILSIFCVSANISNADLLQISDDDKSLMQSLQMQSKEIILDKMKEIMDQDGFDQEFKEEILNPRPELQIFVSSSMPISLLKSYASEAKKYGGVLVFNGLPDGSFRKLTDLAYEISEEETAGIQIDDESFNLYSITQVPTIVLSESKSLFSKNPEDTKYDKIAGAISIKGALEIFANNGDVAKYARRLLK